MEHGMLWFANDQKPLVEKVKSAALYFQKKYGRTPDLVLVHPSMMTASVETVPFYGVEIHVRPYRSVLPGHLWVGVDDVPEYAQKPEQNAEGSEQKAEMQEIKGAEAQMRKRAEVAA